MNVLVVTDVLWRDDNGVGNSYSNIFRDIKDINVANICCQSGQSKNNISRACFQISESSLIKNLKNKNIPSGVVEDVNAPIINAPTKAGFFSKIKRFRLQIFFWLRNLIWKLGRWKSEGLKKFIDDFKPDVIFAQLQDKIYLNNLIRFIKDYTGKPLFVYAWDDVYSLKQFSLSPLFWIDRLFQRRSIRKLTKKCDILYTICDEQRIEYEKKLKVKTKLLYKGYDFIKTDFISNLKEKEYPIKILYTGNLYSGRYKTIKKFCADLKEINKEKTLALLDVYSATPLSKKQIKKINIENVSTFGGRVSEEQVKEYQKQSDVLLHVEPFTLKGSLLCRLSFSTKLVDYFYNGKCVFAVGHKRCSSMKYLKRNDAGIVVEKKKDVKNKLLKLLRDLENVKIYQEKSWKCGEKNHQIKAIQSMLIENFNKSIKKD